MEKPRRAGDRNADADVIVVGAGAAGLAAARSVARRSLRVVVLEARDRIGGRAWSSPLARAIVPAELGAEFIHGRARETTALLREMGTASIDVGGESWTCFDNGELRRDEEVISAASVFERVRTLTADESVDRFLQRFATDSAMREIAADARGFVEGFEAADPAIASARAIADEWRTGVDSTSARPIGGYRPIFEHVRNVCAAAGVEMHLATSVRRISWRRGAVALDVCDSLGECRTIRARCAIITLPVGVLRHRGEGQVVLEPELPASKREALAHIEMGHVVKIVLWFRTAFWEQLDDGRYRDAAFFYRERQPFQTYWTQFPVRSESIVAWIGGPKAFALSGTSQSELVDRALRGFGDMFGERALAHSEFDGAVMHDWDHDPFARGAYSYVAVGGGNARATLAAHIDDTLFFAGEATSTDGQGGTVNGALETGERAAREAATVLGGPVPSDA